MNYYISLILYFLLGAIAFYGSEEELLGYFPASTQTISCIKNSNDTISGNKHNVRSSIKTNKSEAEKLLKSYGKPIALLKTSPYHSYVAGTVILFPEWDLNKKESDRWNESDVSLRHVHGIPGSTSVSYLDQRGRSVKKTLEHITFLIQAYKFENLKLAVDAALREGEIRSIQGYQGYEIFKTTTSARLTNYYAVCPDNILLEAGNPTLIRMMINVYLGEAEGILSNEDLQNALDIVLDLDFTTPYGSQWQFRRSNSDLVTKIEVLKKLRAPIAAVEDVRAQFQDVPMTLTSYSTFLMQSKKYFQTKTYYIFEDSGSARNYFKMVDAKRRLESKTGKVYLGDNNEVSINRSEYAPIIEAAQIKNNIVITTVRELLRVSAAK